MNRTHRKKGVILMLTLLFTLSMTACTSSTFDAAAYTKSVLDATYHQEFKEYAEFCGISEEEARTELEADFDEQVDAELGTIADLGDFTEEEKAEYKEMLISISKLAKYEVDEAVEDEDGNFTVTLKVSAANVYQTLQEHSTKLAKEMAKTGVDIMDPSNFQKLLIQSMQQSIDENKYKEAVTIRIAVTQNSEEQYEISEEDLQLLSDSLFPN